MSANLLIYRCPHCNTPVEVDAAGEDEMLVCPSPRCGKPFRAEVPSAKPIMGTAPPNALPAATKAADQEEQLQQIRLATFRRFPFRWLAYVLLTVAAMTALTYGILVGSSLWWVSGGVLLAYSALRLLVWWLRMNRTTLTLTTKRWIVTSGTLSEETTEIPLDTVNDVRVQQDWMARLLNVGDIHLVSDNGERRQVIVMGVPDPQRVADLVRLKA